MLILPQKYYICSVNNKHNPTHSIQGIGLSSPSKHFSLKRLKKFQYQEKIDYIWDKQYGQHNDYQSQGIN